MTTTGGVIEELDTLTDRELLELERGGGAGLQPQKHQQQLDFGSSLER